MDATEQQQLQDVYDEQMDKLEAGGLIPEAMARLDGIVSGIEMAAAAVRRDVYADWAARHPPEWKRRVGARRWERSGS